MARSESYSDPKETVLSKSSSLTRIGSGRSAKVFRDDFYTIKRLHVRCAFVVQFFAVAVAVAVATGSDIRVDIDSDDVDGPGAGVGIL